MRVSIHFALPVAAVLFGLLVIPRAALAQVNDCPVEPATGVPIADGGIFTGTNCNLYTSGDVDSFVFDGTNGDTYLLAAAINGAAPTNICLTLYNPSDVQIFSGCTTIYNGGVSVVTSQTVTATGLYTVVITETSTATINYAVSLERLYPFPPNAQPIPKLEQPVNGDITPLTDTNAFTFVGATTGTYRATATLASGASQNLCMNVYQPDGTIPSNGSGCTTIYNGGITVQIDFTPNQNGTNMLFLAVSGYDGTASYTLEVSCLVGTCPPIVPPAHCTLEDALSYASGTLTMNFTVENTYATTWNIWLTDQNSIKLLYSKSQPITDSPTAVPMTAPLTPEGNVGVLSTLTTPAKGITCSSWVQIQTGAP